MILLRDIRDFIAALKIAEDEHCYCGKMPDRKDKSIGVYNLKHVRSPTVAMGGEENSSYGIKGISLLVHWSVSPTETERAAIKLYEALKITKQTEVNGHNIKFITMLADEPVSVDTDDNGIYEYVIECLFYYQK